MDQDKRNAPRISMPGGLAGEVSVLAPVEIREFSERGAMMDTAFPLLLDSIHDLRLDFEDVSVVVKGRVVHCSIADLGGDLVRYRAGMEFVDLAPHAAAAIRAHLERLRERRATGAAGGNPPSAT